jgi:hypothetical protein
MRVEAAIRARKKAPASPGHLLRSERIQNGSLVPVSFVSFDLDLDFVFAFDLCADFEAFTSPDASASAFADAETGSVLADMFVEPSALPEAEAPLPFALVADEVAAFASALAAFVAALASPVTLPEVSVAT